ncbi:MAG: hypothetical protein AAB440_00685 [Patescibacteria group bacterium]
MDDLVIEGKTYLSSKRAAEVTGYAKDYVGQLCREGRVEARLVGRSWYVLEGSIREHRFGENEDVAKEIQTAPEEIKTGVGDEEVSPWNSPKYVSEEVAPLPELRPKLIISRPLNLLARDETSDISNVQAPRKDLGESRLLEDRFPTEVSQEVEEEVNIAIHKVSEVEKTPNIVKKLQVSEPMISQRHKTRTTVQKRGKNFVQSAILIAIAIISLAVILIGTGYIDSAPFEGKNESIIDYLGGKSLYSK